MARKKDKCFYNKRRSSKWREKSLTTKETPTSTDLCKDPVTIEQETRGQAISAAWRAERAIRLTASNFGTVLGLRKVSSTQNCVNTLRYGTFCSKNMQYGKENESKALEAFTELYVKDVDACGLFVDRPTQHPYLAASPDGLVRCENALVEVKCLSAAARENCASIEDAIDAGKVKNCKIGSDGTVELRPKSHWFSQIQGQLNITGRLTCYLILYTPAWIHVIIVKKDEKYWTEEMVPKLEKFYNGALLPEIVEPMLRKRGLPSDIRVLYSLPGLYVAPGARLNYQLRLRLERLSQPERQMVVRMMKDGCTALFVACKRGHVEIVDYLVTVCGADVEQRGLYEVPDDRSTHCVTPLWCAAVSGKLPVIKCLVGHGADINAVSDTGSTPVRSACFMTHLDIVRYLVLNGADIQRGNYNGGTCLINSVQSVELCSFLLCHGAKVNAKDVQNKTALHYAIQEHRLETTKLLLEHGADPYARSRYNDDALQTACLKGAVHIFNYLVNQVPYSPQRLADAHDLIGSTFLDEHNEIQTALRHWELAAIIRHLESPPLPKLPELPPQAAFGFAREFRTEAEIRALALDLDALRTQSLLICERVLGPQHKDALFRLMYRGAAYADSLLYQRCIDLWRRALEIRVAKDSIFYNDTCFSAQALVRLYVDLAERHLDWRGDGPKFDDVAATFSVLADQLPAARQLLEIRPVHRKQQETFDRVLRCVTHLIYLLVETGRTEVERTRVRSLVGNLVIARPRSAVHGDTLLHLCVSRLNTCNGTYLAERSQQPIFPNIGVVELLLECGAAVNARNLSLATPLHIAANTYNFNPKLVEVLLEHGAHLDQPNASGESPRNLLQRAETPLPLAKYDTLKCLAATAVVKHRIHYKGIVPATLAIFLSYHEPHL